MWPLTLAQQLPDPKSFQSIGWVIVVLITIGGGYLLFLRIINERRKQSRTGQEPHTILPDPLRVKRFDDDYITRSQLNEVVKKMEKELEDKIKNIEEDLSDIKEDAKEGRDLATQQFQKIEGQLGELRSTSTHTNALAIRTDLRVANLSEELPEKIANAVARNARK